MITDNHTTESREAGFNRTRLALAGKPPRMVVMFVGRAVTADVLTEALADWNTAHAPPLDEESGQWEGDGSVDGGSVNDGSVGDDAEKASPALVLHTFTSQKAVLQEIRANPPQTILVEVDGKPESRVRFCEMLRYRLPSATLIAVANPPLQSKFAFDGTLSLPLEKEPVVTMLREVAARLVGHVLQVGSIRLNVATRTVYTPNGQHHMTPKQSALLQFLMAHANEVVGRGEIMEQVWETDYLEDTRTLDVHIRWLRECIEPDPSNPVYLLTVRGKGYTLQV